MDMKKFISFVAGLGLAVTVNAQTRAVSFRSQEGNYWQMRSHHRPRPATRHPQHQGGTQ